MAQRRRRAPVRETAIEQHPIYHKWYHVGDFVHARNAGGKPMVVRREERCEFCPTQRYTRIDVRTWTRIRGRTYVYAPGVKITRQSKAEFLKREFLATTNLTGADLEALR